MEAKQKAQQLVDKMSGFTYEDCIYNAIICVDEIIKVCPYISKENCDTVEQIRANYNQFVEYWQQVKIELEKLKIK